MAPKPVALIDATDLYPQDQRDFLVQAAFDGLYQLVWSDTLLQETACAIHRRLRDKDGLSQRPKTERMLGQLTGALSTVGAGIGADEAGIRAQIVAMGSNPAAWGTSDPDDRHVIAAAAVADVDVLVTSDDSFDVLYCQQQFNLLVMDADRFLVDVFAQATEAHIRVPLDALAARWKRPAPFSRTQVVGRLETPLPQAMAYVVAERGLTRADPPIDL